jgi:hypothetical protein
MAVRGGAAGRSTALQTTKFASASLDGGHCNLILNTSRHTAALGYLLEGKGGRCVVITTLPPSCTECLEILEASTSGSPKGACILYTRNYTVNLEVRFWSNFFFFLNNHKGYKQHSPPSEIHRTRTRWCFRCFNRKCHPRATHSYETNVAGCVTNLKGNWTLLLTCLVIK